MNKKKILLVIIHVAFSTYMGWYTGDLLRSVNLDLKDKLAVITATVEFFVIILRIVLVWLFLYYLIERTIRNRRAKKHGFCSYLSNDIWVDSIPGSRNGTILLFSYFNFYQTIEGVCRLFDGLYDDRMFFDLRVSVVHLLTTRKYVILILLAVINILITIGGSFLFYWNKGGGSNFFDKKNGRIYITRYGIPGEGRFRVWEIKMQDICCLILVTNNFCGDVLYLKTREQETFALTPINGSCYNLREKGVELSRFLSVPLKIIQFNSKESK
uniref:Photosystem I assembly protein Ycf4 n=1 Tax=Lathyrus palustris TaxID=313104 RepID=D5MAE7_LATPA|nr:photosystem I assembly protein Ycf4 [Lathyrus palustris]